MRIQKLVLVSAVLLVLLLLLTCNSKQNSKMIEVTDIDTVKAGKYIGVPYKLTSSFMPILTIEDNGEFKLELGINKSIEGKYKTENNKLILTSFDGEEKYTLEISDNILIIEQEISSYVKKGTNFKFAEKG